MVQTIYKVSFMSDLYSAKMQLKDILEYLKNEVPNLTEDDFFDLRIIYNELINNAIIHGNKQDITKKVEVSVEIRDCDIMSIVRDEGIGFDYTSLFRKLNTSYDTLREHRRGLQLVHSLADFIELNDLGNEIIFQKNLNI